MSYVGDKEPRELRERLFLVKAVLFISFFVLASRFWYLQVMERLEFAELSRTNRIRLVNTTAPRGLIFDRSGLRLAENRPGFDLSVIPEDVRDWEKTKKTLTELVRIEPRTIEARIEKARKRSPFRPVRLKEDLSWEEMVKVESFKFELPGVVLEVGPRRAYPYGDAIAHILGYLGEINEREVARARDKGVSYRPGDMVGKNGVETMLETTLRGVDGGRHTEVDALGREIKTVSKIPPEPGNNTFLTIDLPTQLIARDAMSGKAGAVVAMEPRTGRIIAMVSTPSFDPNMFASGISAENWKAIIENPLNVLTNRAIQGQYPPASTFKPITASAALEEKLITPEEKIFSGPSFRFGRRDYRDWKKAGHGKINVHSAIVESSDTFFYQVGLKVGVDRLARYAKSFGFGTSTGMGLKDEKPGLVPSSEWKKRALGERWYTGETISISVGQGYMLATPMQLVAAYAAIANGGKLLKPRIVERTETPEGELIEEFFTEEAGELAVSPETLEILRSALRGVVEEEGGTARRLMKGGLKIAGKTGTAQVIRLKEREKDIEKIPYKQRDHAWFVGFAPYDDPVIAVVVLVEHGGFGSRAAAPVALRVFETYLSKKKEEEEQEI
ncbi:MAG: penicillin-binding protein 2 [Thermodesulfobacteriota bacterium]